MHGNRPFNDLADDCFESRREFPHYRDWLLANATAKGWGNRMRRALIRAEQRHNKLKPTRIRASQIRRGYPRRWR
jgi:hypothetical protein